VPKRTAPVHARKANSGAIRELGGGTMRRGSVDRARSIALAFVSVAFALALVPAIAAARTTTEQPSSILIFPKVIADGTRDTFIQISNTANSVVHAHCLYVNAYPTCQGIGDCQEGTCSGACVPQWQEIDFNIWLTKQQPTHWGVSFGRRDGVAAPTCNRDIRTGEREYDCYDAGLSPGLVPPVPLPFEGELRCIEVDQSGAPISGNHLKGEATIISRDGDASKYNAVGILGEPFTNNGDNVLCLGGEPSAECPTGAEYQGCPDRFWIPHFASGADNPIFGPTSTVRTEFTAVPCRVNFERASLDPTRVTLQFFVFNEFEGRLSASTQVECWRSFFLEDANPIFSVAVQQTRLVQTSVRPVVPSSGSGSSVAMVVEEFHALPNGSTARAAYNAHERGEFGGSEVIELPAGP